MIFLRYESINDTNKGGFRVLFGIFISFHDFLFGYVLAHQATPQDDIIDNIMRIVLDTNVLVAGLASRRGASHALLRQVANDRVRLLAAPALWLEYEAVLKRPEIRRMHGLSVQEVEDFLDALAIRVEPVHLDYLWRPQLDDPADEMVFEAALNARADALVTFNQRDFSLAARHFALRLLTPAACFFLLENQS